MLKGGVPKKDVEKKMKEDGENPAVVALSPHHV